LKPRRILYVTRIAEGGVAVVVNELATKMDTSRYEPFVLFDTCKNSNIRKNLSRSGIKTIDLEKPCNDEASGLPIHSQKRDIRVWLENHLGSGAGQVYFSLKAFREFLQRQAPKIRSYMRTIRENQIDLVHTHHDINRGKPEIIASWMTGVPCVSHIHGYIELSYFDRFFSRFVDAFIYISTAIAEYGFTQGKSQDKGIIIYNGIDLDKFAQPYDSDHVRAEFGCTSKNILVGIVGRIDWWKGHEYFLEAVAKVAQKIPGIKGMIIGSLEENVAVEMNRRYLGKLHRMVKSLGLKDKIIFTGYREDVPRLISALDVVVHASSKPEPFGIVVIEGMAACKPVIATAAGGVLDIIEDGVNGLLVPCKDTKAMAQAILKIISDRHKADQIGLAAREHVRKKFAVQQQLTAVQNLYDGILGVPRC
jgi:glycosyltransferase involved in cell wall biosynthesis